MLAAAKTSAREPRSGEIDHHVMAGGKFLACRPVCDYAGSHSFVLHPNTYPPQPLKKWVSFWRNQVTRVWPQRNQTPIWQRDYWDRQLRRHESYSQKWNYVVNNPVRHGYVAHAEDWPFQGELNVLSWHD